MMLPFSADSLYGKVPSDWEMDLTPPQPWDDPELDATESMRRWLASFSESTTHNLFLPIVAVSSAMHRAVEELAASLKLPIEQIVTVIEQYGKALQPAIEIQQQLIKIDDEAFGNHVHAGIKKVQLPPRRFNSGPSWNPHARRGKGGRR